MNKHLMSWVCIGAFIFQVFLTFKGVDYFGKYFNPFLLLCSYLALFILFLNAALRSAKDDTQKISPMSKRTLWLKAVAACLCVCAVCISFPLFQALFHKINDPVEISDVLPQLQIQYDRFTHGIFPYQKIDLPHSKPFPVYMPFHWLPISISEGLAIDIRWCGLILLVPVAALYGWITFSESNKLLYQAIIIALPLVILLAFIQWGQNDLAVSLETIIAAYYMFLAIGLYKRSFVLTIVGIVLCLLSRYTLIFWLPLFLLLLYFQTGRRLPVYAILICLTAVCLFYVFPFILHDPSIFLTGLKYHNGAAEFEWEYGAWSFETGIYFAPDINAVVSGSVAHKVFIARALQAATMIALLVFGIVFFKKKKKQADACHFGLAMLYLFIACFYIIGPLTYRYYMITPLMLSCVIVAATLNRLHGASLVNHKKASPAPL
jgi:hypothetical protein